jgi:AMP-activated protein kinase-like protein
MRPDDGLDPEQHAFLERLAAPLRTPVELSERVERTVLARLRADERPARGWPFRPLAAAAMAAGIAAAFAGGVLVGRRSAVPAAPDRGAHTVEFALRTAADSAVTLVGDFNDWDPRATPLHPGAGGVWTVTVPLRPGRYRYTFIVDGTRWRRDPAAPRALEDDFGTPTSVITVAQR